MLLALLAALSGGGAHASLHPAGADVYVEVPDVSAALAAYARAPAVTTVQGEPAARVAEFTKELGWDLAAIAGGMLPAADPTRPDDRWWPWSACAVASLSVSGIDGGVTTGDVAAQPCVWLIADFKEAAAAEQAEQALLAMGGGEAAPAETTHELVLDTRRVPITPLDDLLTDWLPAAWMCRIDQRLVLAAGAAKPEEYAARCKDPEGGLARAWKTAAEARPLGPGAGVTLAELVADMDDLPAFARGDTTSSIAGAALLFAAPFLSAKGHWRLQLLGDRFVTTGHYEPRGTAQKLDAALGRAPLRPDTARLVPPDAVGAWLTSVDAERAEEMLTPFLLSAANAAGSPIAPPAEGTPHLSAGLGSACAISLLPFQGVMSPTPRIAVAIELRDAAQFQAGLDAWIARATAAFPDLKVERKPYRKTPTITFNMSSQGEGEEGGGGSPLDIGNLEPTRPTLAILGDRVVLASAPSVARSEIKRAQEKGDNFQVPAPAAGLPKDAFEASSMDWAGFVSKLYDAAKGFAPMLAQNLGRPVDVEQLPTSTVLFAAFRPTTSWSRRVEGGVFSYNESSFGPETPLGIAAMGFLASRADRVVATKPAPSAPEAQTPETGDAPAHDDARATTLETLRTVRTGIALYRSQLGAPPAALADLLRGTDSFPDGFLPGGQVPRDGWGRELRYEPAPDRSGYALRSLGPDGVDQQGAGDDVRLP